MYVVAKKVCDLTKKIHTTMRCPTKNDEKQRRA